MYVKLHNIEQIGPNIFTFWFSVTKPVDYQAGQFIEMYLPHDNPDTRGEKHWFTLSSSPTEELISITTKKATDHISTFKQTLFALEKGSLVRISEPMGDFVLPKDNTLPLVFIVGGIGVTPVRSIIKYLTDMKEIRSIHVLYAAKTNQDIVFRELIEDYGAKLDIILSEPSEDWSGNKGRLGGEIVKNTVGLGNQLFFVSGPEPMTEKLEVELIELGISKDMLVLDFFPGYSVEL